MASHPVMPYDFEHDSQWIQFRALYRALMRRQVEADRAPTATEEARNRHKAVMALNNSIINGTARCANEWPSWTPERRQIAVNLALEAFCKSRNDPSCDLREVWLFPLPFTSVTAGQHFSTQVRWIELKPKIWSSTPGPPGPANAVAALLKNAVDLSSVPILVSERPFSHEC